MNTIVASGAIEILSVDETSKEIKGRIHAWSSGDKDNFEVNGNFTVAIE